MSEENNNSTALAVVKQANQLTFKDVQNWGDVFFKSGMFGDIKNAAAAMVKIKAGDELGISPFAAMSGIHIIKDKTSVGAGLQAGLVQNSQHVRYEVVELTENRCELEFFKRGVIDGQWKSAGKSSFSIADAEKAGLADSQNNGKGQNGHMYKKWSRNMIFARAMTNGVKWYAPELLLGADGHANVVDDFDAEEVARDTATGNKPAAAADEKTPEAVERRKHVVECLLRIGALFATEGQMIALKKSIDDSSLALLEKRYIDALGKAREHAQKEIGKKHSGDAFAKFVQEAFPDGINAADCTQIFAALDTLNAPAKAEAAPAEATASEPSTTEADAEVNEGPLTPEEEERFMLIDVINEYIGEKAAGDVDEMKKLVGDRDLTKMTTPDLQKFYDDLQCPF